MSSKEFSAFRRVYANIWSCTRLPWKAEGTDDFVISVNIHYEALGLSKIFDNRGIVGKKSEGLISAKRWISRVFASYFFVPLKNIDSAIDGCFSTRTETNSVNRKSSINLSEIEKLPRDWKFRISQKWLFIPGEITTNSGPYWLNKEWTTRLQ